MSEPVTALGGALYGDGIAEVREMPLQGMITLRGDLSEPAVQRAATLVSPGEMPGPLSARIAGDTGVAWMSPDEALVLCPHAEVAQVLARMREALGTSHALAVNVSDARASFGVSGRHARDVLSKLCPVDLAPDRFSPGMFRRTRMAQVACALWRTGDDSFQIVCFRSHARYVFDLLCVAAQPGSEVSQV